MFHLWAITIAFSRLLLGDGINALPIVSSSSSGCSDESIANETSSSSNDNSSSRSNSSGAVSCDISKEGGNFTGSGNGSPTNSSADTSSSVTNFNSRLIVIDTNLSSNDSDNFSGNNDNNFFGYNGGNSSSSATNTSSNMFVGDPNSYNCSIGDGSSGSATNSSSNALINEPNSSNTAGYNSSCIAANSSNDILASDSSPVNDGIGLDGNNSGTTSSSNSRILTTPRSSTSSAFDDDGDGNTVTNTEVDYAFSFAEFLSALTAEFVLNVAGDHVLFPVEENPQDDQQLHTTAAIVAELLQQLHITAEVYAMLNATAYAVARDAWRSRRRDGNPVTNVMRLMADALTRDAAPLRNEYAAVKRNVDNQIFGLPAQHGRFASDRRQTLYDIRPEQQQHAERLMRDVRVKKLLISVTLFKASQYTERAVPTWARDQMNLAKALFQLAKEPGLRAKVQRLFDETLAEIVEKYDTMGDGGDENDIIFRTLRDKLESDKALRARLNTILNRNQTTETNT